MQKHVKTVLASIVIIGSPLNNWAQNACENITKNATTRDSIFLVQVYPDEQKQLAGCPQIKPKEDHSPITLTGFVLKNDPNHILTALHGVVCAIGEPKANIVASNENGQSASALQVSGVDIANDIALISIGGTSLEHGTLNQTRGLTLEDSADFSINGACVSSIGNPRNLHFEPSPGGRSLAAGPSQLCEVAKQVDGLGNGSEDRHSPDWSAPIYVMELSLSPGDSGSPIFDKAGKVIAMADGTLAPAVERVQWAIPLNLQSQKSIPGLPCSGDARPYQGKVVPTPLRDTDLGYAAIQHLKNTKPPSVLVAFMDLNDSCDSEANEFGPRCILSRLRQFNGKVHGDPPIGSSLYQEHIWLDLTPDMKKKIRSIDYTFADVAPTARQRLNPFTSIPDVNDDDFIGHAMFKIYECDPDVDYEIRISLRDGGVHEYAFNLCNVQQAQWPIPEGPP